MRGEAPGHPLGSAPHTSEVLDAEPNSPPLWLPHHQPQRPLERRERSYKGLTKPPDLTSPFPQGAPDMQLLLVALPCPPRSACPQDPCPSLTDRPQLCQPGSGEELGWLRAAEQQEPGLERTFLEILKEAATTGGAEPGPHRSPKPGCCRAAGMARGAATLPPAPLWAQSAPSSPGKRDAKQRAARRWKHR